ncbi:GNAT family N-acetyltransferase [Salicibibacter kimchii]|uniref:GNAT family N-acetyltransferase n=1 Tax=Salicibibacter kimchii TaxID=2099786 RepID=A0A345BV55_9BACI|nr:GNAT family N-acetyltransferase [Salicibibacter kimchii]AXF54836.1 GNAT family N-acetyltransferase [Salicibibacter kimchii]
MIIKYKPAYRKIAMGLLSYTPELKEVKTLQETMDEYENDESMKLYLWKKEEDIVGVVGLQESSDGDVMLRHICVNPSYRHEGIADTILSTMEEKLGKNFIASDLTREFLEKRKNK